MVIDNFDHPTLSVIIATYNWSAALRCALQSVQLQTFADFEVLVVGDCCTDDSEDVVKSFNDRRFKWHNLDRNYGGQWAPNNYGLATAAGEWIAYLGHDDIWHPAHLESALRTAREQKADLVASVMISYGPPQSGIRGLSGVFVDGVYGPSDFMPPSSVLHRKSLIDRIGSWKDPETIILPTDCEFLRAAAEAATQVASTNELTAFKFNAAWRRDSYKLKSTTEQQEMLAKLNAGYEFRHHALLGVLHAMVADKLLLMKIPEIAHHSADFFRSYRKYKGVDEPYALTDLLPIEAPRRFNLTNQFAPLEWHLEEDHLKFGPYRWSGPLARASVDLPVRFDRDAVVTVHIIAAIEPGLLDTIKLFINDYPAEFNIKTTADGTFMLSMPVTPSEYASEHAGLRVTLEVVKTKRPCDIGFNNDTRSLGVAVNWVEVGPG
jgi:glycosyltransferase involved in cell wall biosynthesis